MANRWLLVGPLRLEGHHHHEATHCEALSPQNSSPLAGIRICLPIRHRPKMLRASCSQPSPPGELFLHQELHVSRGPAYVAGLAFALAHTGPISPHRGSGAVRGAGYSVVSSLDLSAICFIHPQANAEISPHCFPHPTTYKNPATFSCGVITEETYCALFRSCPLPCSFARQTWPTHS